MWMNQMQWGDSLEMGGEKMEMVKEFKCFGAVLSKHDGMERKIKENAYGVKLMVEILHYMW